MPTMRFSNAQLAPCRAEIVGGRDFLIAPTIIIREGVLNDWFVTGEAIEASAAEWENIPVTVDHPADDDGVHCSIYASDDLMRAAIGMFRNVHYDSPSRSLKGNLWIDIEQAQSSVGGRKVLYRLQKGQPLEVSTGYVTAPVLTSGRFGGKPYSEIHRSLVPDHLALLPDNVGACSWKDGCGAPRMNDTKEKVMSNEIDLGLKNEEEYRYAVNQHSEFLKQWGLGDSVIPLSPAVVLRSNKEELETDEDAGYEDDDSDEFQEAEQEFFANLRRDISIRRSRGQFRVNAEDDEIPSPPALVLAPRRR